MLLIIFLIIAFALGAVPFSFLIAKRVKGIDLRQHGSGNLGATNVFRTLGPWWGGLCLLLDLAKGAAAVGLMTWLVSTWPEGEPTPFRITPDLFRIFAGFLAAMGHTFSPFVGFHGGKGVATTGGAFAVLAPYPVILATVAFLSVLASTRLVSLASITAASVLPVAVLFFELTRGRPSLTIIAFVFLTCAWVIFRHRSNIVRLQNGTETRIGARSGSNSGSRTAPAEGSDHPTDEPSGNDK
ncbi:glycerol-3-phosphate 1-O-acyltransferase PlsY [bacterium]|nr:glycerol-3-phosphate 1-O-acyltransferase PlsY [bacterium]